jgi:hypothetical protein
VTCFDHNHPLGNAPSQKIFQRFCHWSHGFSGSHNQNPLDIFQIKTPVINLQHITAQPNMAVYGFNRINRPQAGLKNLKGMLPHLLINSISYIHISPIQSSMTPALQFASVFCALPLLPHSTRLSSSQAEFRIALSSVFRPYYDMPLVNHIN